MDSQLMLPSDRPLALPFRPLAAVGVCIASWLLGCALAGDTNDDAKAGLQAGGPITGCYMTAKIDCPLRCSDIDFDAICDATLGANCDGHCGAEATGACLDDCASDCHIGCAAKADVDCNGTCWDRCDGNCKKLCAGAVNPDQCNEMCGGDCSTNCRDQCGSNSDSTCDGKCNASCSATCSVEAHVACELRCSVDGFTTCKARAAAQCVAECSSSVMLTCSDPSGPPPDGIPAQNDAPVPPAAQKGGVPWVPSVVDQVSIQRGFAKFAPREETAPPPVEAPPLKEAHIDAPQTAAAPDAGASADPPPPTE